jgi:hypothetical protein
MRSSGGVEGTLDNRVVTLPGGGRRACSVSYSHEAEVEMAQTLTITLPDDVYDELRRRAGQEDVGVYIQRLVSPSADSDQQLEEGYRAMAADTERERDALEWIETAPDDALP